MTERAELTERERADYEPVAALLRGASLLTPSVRGGPLRARVGALVEAHLRGLARFGGPLRLPVEYTASAIELTQEFHRAWGSAPPREPARPRAEPLHYRDAAGAAPGDPHTQWRRALGRASAPLRSRAGPLERALLSAARDAALASPAWGWLTSRVRREPRPDEDGLERIYTVADLTATAVSARLLPEPPKDCARVLSNPLLDPLFLYARERIRERADAGAAPSPWLPVIELLSLGVYPVALPDRLVVWIPSPKTERDGAFRLHASLGLWRLFDFGAPPAQLAATRTPDRYDARGFAPLRFIAFVLYPPVEGPLPPPDLPRE